LDVTILLTGYAYAALIMAVSCFFGVLIATFLMEAEVADKIGRVLIPLIRASHLPEELSLPAIMSLLDNKTAHLVVSSLRKEEKIGDSVVITYNLVTRPFTTVSMLIRTSLPVALAALGLYVGLFYVSLVIAAAFMCMVAGTIYGRIKLKLVSSLQFKIPISTIDKPSRRGAFRAAFKKATAMVRFVMKRYLLVLAFMIFLTLIGFFDWLGSMIGAYTRMLGFSPEFALLLSVRSVAPTVGILMAGEMLRVGMISVREALLALIIGRLIFLIIFDYPRHAFPFYSSIYPLKLAAKLVLIGIVVNALATPILVIIILLLT